MRFEGGFLSSNAFIAVYFAVRYPVMETGVRRYTDEHAETRSGSPTSGSGTYCEGILKWPSSCTGSPRPSPARTR